MPSSSASNSQRKTQAKEENGVAWVTPGLGAVVLTAMSKNGLVGEERVQPNTVTETALAVAVSRGGVGGSIGSIWSASATAA